jgi:hypothetical protein
MDTIPSSSVETLVFRALQSWIATIQTLIRPDSCRNSEAAISAFPALASPVATAARRYVIVSLAPFPDCNYVSLAPADEYQRPVR